LRSGIRDIVSTFRTCPPNRIKPIPGLPASNGRRIDALAFQRCLSWTAALELARRIERTSLVAVSPVSTITRDFDRLGFWFVSLSFALGLGYR